MAFTYGTDGAALNAAPQTKQRQKSNTFSTTQQSECSNDSLGADGEGNDFFDANQQNKAQRAWTSSLQQRRGHKIIYQRNTALRSNKKQEITRQHSPTPCCSEEERPSLFTFFLTRSTLNPLCSDASDHLCLSRCGKGLERFLSKRGLTEQFGKAARLPSEAEN